MKQEDGAKQPEQPAVFSLRRSLKAFLYLAGLCILAFPVLGLLQRRGVPSEAAANWTVGIFVAAFVILYVLPYEVDRRIYGTLTAALMGLLWRRTVRSTIVFSVCVASVSIILAWPTTDSLEGAPSPYLITAVASLIVAGALSSRALIRPSDIARLTETLITLPIALLIAPFIVISGLIMIFQGYASIRAIVAAQILVYSALYIFIDLRLSRKRNQLDYIEKNLEDVIWAHPLKPAASIQKGEPADADSTKALIRAHIKTGRLEYARKVLKLHGDKLPPKEITKVKCRILYREKRFSEVLTAIDNYNQERSDVLVSLKALSMLRMGKVEEARNALQEAIDSPDRVKRNPYLYLNRGIVKRYLNDLPGAIEDTDLANSIYRAQENAEEGRDTAAIHEAHISEPAEAERDCPLALNNKSYFGCLRLLEEYPASKQTMSGELGEYLVDCCHAIRIMPDYAYASLSDTLGFICLLQRKFDLAGRLFTKALKLAGSPSAMNHLAVLYMIDAPNYTRSQYFLDAAILSLRENPSDPEYKIACLNRNRINEAKKSGTVFNDNIIYYQLQPGTPAEALGRPSQQIINSLDEAQTLYLSWLSFVGGTLGAINFALFGNPEKFNRSVRENLERICEETGCKV